MTCEHTEQALPSWVEVCGGVVFATVVTVVAYTAIPIFLWAVLLEPQECLEHGRLV